MGHQLSKDGHYHNHNQQQDVNLKQHPLAVNEAFQRAAGHGLQDDVRSRTTETTMSSTPPASPQMMMFCSTSSRPGADRGQSSSLSDSVHQGLRISCRSGGQHDPSHDKAESRALLRSVASEKSSADPQGGQTLQHHQLQQHGYHLPTVQRLPTSPGKANVTAIRVLQDPSLPSTQVRQTTRHRSSVPVKCPPSLSSSRRGASRRYTSTGYGGDHDDDCCQEDASYIERMYDLKSWDMFHRITQARKHWEEQRRQKVEAAATDAAANADSAGLSFSQRQPAEVSASNKSSSALRHSTKHSTTLFDNRSSSENAPMDPTRVASVPHDHQLQQQQMHFGVMGSALSPSDGTDDGWENLGLDYDDDDDENGWETSESQLIFLFDL